MFVRYNSLSGLRFYLALCLLGCCVLPGHAEDAAPSSVFSHGRFWYVGALGGYGSTTWEGLVPPITKRNQAIAISAPVRVEEGGEVWGLIAGYEVMPNLAIEVNYMRYPDATIAFDASSLFSFDNNGLEHFTTRTEAFSVLAKVQLPLPHTPLRLFSSFGGANVHREDMLTNQWRWSPTFGAGINFPLTKHFRGEFGANYTAGFGESQLNPTQTYFPFLYSVTLRAVYCFNLG